MMKLYREVESTPSRKCFFEKWKTLPPITNWKNAKMCFEVFYNNANYCFTDRCKIKGTQKKLMGKTYFHSLNEILSISTASPMRKKNKACKKITLHRNMCAIVNSLFCCERAEWVNEQRGRGRWNTACTVGIIKYFDVYYFLILS